MYNPVFNMSAVQAPRGGDSMVYAAAQEALEEGREMRGQDETQLAAERLARALAGLEAKILSLKEKSAFSEAEAARLRATAGEALAAVGATIARLEQYAEAA